MAAEQQRNRQAGSLSHWGASQCGQSRLPIGSDRPQLVEVRHMQDLSAVGMQAANHKSPAATLHLLPEPIEHFDERRAEESNVRQIDQHLRDESLTRVIDRRGDGGHDILAEVFELLSEFDDRDLAIVEGARFLGRVHG